MTKKLLTKEEYAKIPKLPFAVTSLEKDYQDYVNQTEWKRLVNKLKWSIKRRKAHTQNYEETMKEFLSLCEKNNLPSVLNV